MKGSQSHTFNGKREWPWRNSMQILLRIKTGRDWKPGRDKKQWFLWLTPKSYGFSSRPGKFYQWYAQFSPPELLHPPWTCLFNAEVNWNWKTSKVLIFSTRLKIPTKFHFRYVNLYQKTRKDSFSIFNIYILSRDSVRFRFVNMIIIILKNAFIFARTFRINFWKWISVLDFPIPI